ncbi:hypothetical protein [Piscinibacterium candidicorallinum]|jgi:hypothetical protein|uniref:hypothetical protein n=1 Tax=Piscinibacterium candidicorallinum TaxID=1793872 RepID=UPI0039E1DF88
MTTKIDTLSYTTIGALMLAATITAAVGGVMTITKDEPVVRLDTVTVVAKRETAAPQVARLDTVTITAKRIAPETTVAGGSMLAAKNVAAPVKL